MPRVWLRSSHIQALRCDRTKLLHYNRTYVDYRQFHALPSHRAEVVPLRKQLKDADKASRTNRGCITTSDSLSPEVLSRWELTVGIEIHAQLNTARKLFSRAPSENDDEVNKKLSAFDISLPGSQPSFQTDSLIPALRTAIALNCEVQSVSRFDRKHYFYHDQPAGYQITQYYHPFARNGTLTLTEEDGVPPGSIGGTTIGIKQIQLEQDTAKTQELEDGTSMIDFTRSGQPLIEIISLPQIHSPAVAAAFMRKVQALLYSVDAVTTGMELGGLRADVNVSVRKVGDTQPGMTYGGLTKLGQRTEIKNLSSFKAVEDAVKAERDRQIHILEAGGTIEGETRGWSINNPGDTRRLRGKEGEVDYRYMPDPDVPPLYIANDLLSHLRNNLPRTPDQLSDMLVNQYGLSRTDAKTLIALDDGERLNYFQKVVHLCTKGLSEYPRFGKVTGNWVLHELGSLLTTNDVAWSATIVPALQLKEIIMLAEQSQITNTSAKSLLKLIFAGDPRPVTDIVEQEGFLFRPLSEAEYSELAEKVLQAHPEVVRDIQDKGKKGKIQFLVGQMMRTGERSRMEATRVESILREKILPSDA